MRQRACATRSTTHSNLTPYLNISNSISSYLVHLGGRRLVPSPPRAPSRPSGGPVGQPQTLPPSMS
eukprot:scaffold23482_cov32-Tisochrysis_lutea.AAC.5